MALKTYGQRQCEKKAQQSRAKSKRQALARRKKSWGF